MLMSIVNYNRSFKILIVKSGYQNQYPIFVPASLILRISRYLFCWNNDFLSAAYVFWVCLLPVN